MILGPTFDEMLHPETVSRDTRRRAEQAAETDPLDPINLFNITWRDHAGHLQYEVLPAQLTGVEAPIAVIYGKDFPTGSHKVGAAYSVLLERYLGGEVDPATHRLVWPSTGNYGIAGAWVGARMGFESFVVLPEGMSRERFELIASYGGKVIATPGCESNVKEIYDKCKELRSADPERVCVLNQFEVFGNYRFHHHVTGNSAVELAAELANEGTGNGKVAAFVSAMGSGGTIAAGDRLKQVWPDHKIIGVEPIQCPTLFCNGYGAHDIQGIGDKHVTWIHNVLNMDAMVCVDDLECKKGLQVLAEGAGWDVLTARYGIAEDKVRRLSQIFGISGVCNVLGAIKTAKYFGFGKDDLVVTVCTDAIDRYRSTLSELTAQYGPVDQTEAAVRMESIFHRQKTDWVLPGTPDNRRRWHNLKYFTWVEQQGKTVEELNAQLDPEFWLAEQAKVGEIDRQLFEIRG